MTKRRAFGWLGTAAWLIGSLGSASVCVADPINIPSSTTTLVGTAERIVSYRHQSHMWQTSDGATHVLINRGNLPSGKALSLRSTFDGGSTWVGSGIDLPNTDLTATSDGFLADDVLGVTYSSAAGDLYFAQVRYDSGPKTWSLLKNDRIFAASSAALALTPAVAADTLGRLWLAYVYQDNATSNYSIRMMLKVSDAEGWVDTGFVFGLVDGPANERAARPIAIAGGMGIVFTVHSTTYWAKRNDSWPVTQTWPVSTIYVKTDPQTDPFGSHFSVTADAQQNLHMALADGGRLVYSRFLAATQTWSTRALTGNVQTNYMQALTSMGNVVVVANTLSVLRVFQSTDGGNSFAVTHALTHPAATSTTTYDRPRIETPASSATPMPVLQQYADGSLQRLMFFAVPVVK